MKQSNALYKNSFSEETRAIFAFDQRCFKCSRNQNVEFDHIMQRTSSSVFNACPLCRRCHQEKTSKYNSWQLRLIAEFLIREGYILKKKDLDFLNKYKSYYKKNGMGYWWKKKV